MPSESQPQSTHSQSDLPAMSRKNTCMRRFDPFTYTKQRNVFRCKYGFFDVFRCKCGVFDVFRCKCSLTRLSNEVFDGCFLLYKRTRNDAQNRKWNVDDKMCGKIIETIETMTAGGIGMNDTTNRDMMTEDGMMSPSVYSYHPFDTALIRTGPNASKHSNSS
eukprot:272393_1